MNGMVYVGRGNFQWTASNRLLELRMLFGVKVVYGEDMNMSGRGNGVSRLTYIKQVKNVGLLSKNKRSHNGRG